MDNKHIPTTQKIVSKLHFLEV